MRNKLKEILNDALIQILKEIGIKDVVGIEDPRTDLTCEIIITIGITGNLTGTMMLKSDRKSALGVSQMMLNKINHFPEGDDFSESHQEAIREIMNLISARSLMILSEQKIDCNLTPPTLIMGENISPSMYNISYSVNTAVTGNFGTLYLFFGVKKDDFADEL
ncbi:MAG: chemotaxis protein CheX [Spirochaetales bacterium]|nr:chemotaxis protein CheX [Spirochaetales bacterium]